MSAAAKSLLIRPCESQEDVRLCIDLQRSIWGVSDVDLVPAHIYFVARETGGQVYLAFDQNRAIAFALAFSAERDHQRYLHSHMVGVLPELQNHGVGRMLKLRQREEALAAGITRIEWTFDPLELRNAYFNIVRLGAIVRRSIADCYGESSSVLHRGLPTDRLVAEWRLDSPRVKSAIAGESNPAGARAVEVAAPQVRRLQSQSYLRNQLSGLFARGYAITGFRSEPGNPCYLLEPYED